MVDPFDRLVNRADHVFAEKTLDLFLGRLPGGNRFLKQVFSRWGQAEGVSPTIFVGNGFQPALRFHPIDVATERRDIDVQAFAENGGAGYAESCGRHQNVELADLEPEWAASSS